MGDQCRQPGSRLWGLAEPGYEIQAHLGTQTQVGLEPIPSLQWTQLRAGPEFLQGCKWYHSVLARVTKTATRRSPCFIPGSQWDWTDSVVCWIPPHIMVERQSQGRPCPFLTPTLTLILALSLIFVLTLALAPSMHPTFSPCLSYSQEPIFQIGLTSCLRGPTDHSTHGDAVMVTSPTKQEPRAQKTVPDNRTVQAAGSLPR